jgi:hypothetical protein
MSDDHGHGHAVIKRVNPLSVMQENEQVICEINRNPIGLFTIYGIGGGLLLVIAAFSFIYLHQLVASLSVVALALIIVGGFLFIVSKIYWDNYWIVTDDSLTQLTRSSLFDREACQLSFANLEDVSAQQSGFWAHMFHYGVISAETAAATDKFVLTFCPNPHDFAQKILAAREEFEQGRGTRKKSSSKDDKPSDNDSLIDSYDVPTGDD